MSWLLDDDICWCADSDICEATRCFRHLKHREPNPAPDILTLAHFKDTPDCPRFNTQRKEENK